MASVWPLANALVQAILEHLDDEVEWDREAPSYGARIYEPGVGKEHVQRFFAAVAEDLEFIRFEPTNFLSGGDQVAVPVHVEATVNPTGKTFKALEIHLWTFGANGKLSHFFQCIDRHAVVLAYGL